MTQLGRNSWLGVEAVKENEVNPAIYVDRDNTE